MEEKEISFIDCISFVKRNKKFILTFTVVVFVLCLCVMILSLVLPQQINFLPNRFTAQSIVRINATNSSNGLSSMLDLPNSDSISGLMRFNNSQNNSNTAWAIELSKSRTVLDEISNTFDLVNLYSKKSKYPVVNTRKEILKNIEIEESEESGALIISYTDDDKYLAANIVNQLVEILEAEFSKIDYNSNSAQKKILDENLKKSEQAIINLHDEIYRFQIDNDVINPEKMAEELSVKVMRLKADLVVKQTELQLAKEKNPSNSPVLHKMKLEVEALERVLESLENGNDNNTFHSVKDLPKIVIEFQEKYRLLEAQSVIYSTLLKEVELLKFKKDGTGPTLQVIEKAEVPLVKSTPHRGRICIVAIFIGFFISLIIAFFKDFWINLKNDPEAMKKLKGE